VMTGNDDYAKPDQRMTHEALTNTNTNTNAH